VDGPGNTDWLRAGRAEPGPGVETMSWRLVEVALVQEVGAWQSLWVIALLVYRWLQPRGRLTGRPGTRI